MFVGEIVVRGPNSTFRSGRAVQRDEDLLISFDPTVVELTQVNFEVNPIKSVGGVRSSTTCENGQKLP